MIKFFNNRKINNIRTVSIFGIPFYRDENNHNFHIQNILKSFIQIKRIKSQVKDCKTYKFFNLTLGERIMENDILRYYIGGFLIKQISLAERFYKKYIKSVKENYDDVYVINSNSGEAFLFLAYIAKTFFNKNGSKFPLFIATKKYHIDLIKMYLPNVNYVFLPKLKIKAKGDYLEYKGHKIYILFSGKHFQKIEYKLAHNNAEEVHYLKSILNTLDFSENEYTKANAIIPIDIIKKTNEKINKIQLKTNNFVIISPEANTCEEISNEFWFKLASELQKYGTDVFLNITTKENYLSNCKTANLNYIELYCLAQKAKAVISLRSGLSEFLLPTNIPNIAIYTKFRDRVENIFPVKKGIEGFSMLEIPFVTKENIKELNYDKFKNEDELLKQVVSELKSYKVFGSKEECVL